MTDNTCIYQDLAPLQELGPNPTIYPILPTHFQGGTLFPDHVRLGLVCMTLSHRINRTRDAGQSNALTETFYRYRGLAIQSLRDDIDVEHKRTSDIVLAGVMTLLLLDVSPISDPPDSPALLDGSVADTYNFIVLRFSMASRLIGGTTWTECSG